MREYESFTVGTCENCKREHVKIRPIEAMGMFKEPRGWYQICFDCFGPRVKWSDKTGTYFSPTDKISEAGNLITISRTKSILCAEEDEK